MKFFCLTFLLFCLLPGPVDAQAPAAPTAADGFFAAGQFDSARQAYAAAEKSAPNDLALRVGLIRTLLRLDNWPDALMEAQAAAQEFPASADAHGLFSLTLIRAGWQEPYAKEAAQSLALNPKNYWGLIASGRAAEWDGQEASARDFYRQASTLSPDLPEAWLGLIHTLSAIANKDEQANAIRVYLKLMPKGHPHDHFREGLDDYQHNSVAYNQSFGNSLLFQRAVGAGAPDAAVTVPIEFEGDSIVVPVQINASRFHLIFDTGAGGVTLTQSAAHHLKLTPITHSYIRGVSGRESSDIYHADTLSLGSLIYCPVLIRTVRETPHMEDGLFGGNILHGSLVTVDYAASTMTITTAANAVAPSPGPGANCIVLPFHVYQSHLFLPLQVNSQTVWALLDTGASASHLSYHEAQSQLKDVPQAQIHSGTLKGRLGIGTSDQQVEYVVSRRPSILVFSADPPVSIAIPTLGISELDREVSPSADFEIGLILGMSSLTYARRVTFDYRRHLLTFEYADPDASAPASTPKK